MSETEMVYRHPKRGRAHKKDPVFATTTCPRNFSTRDFEAVPLSRVDPADLCRWCFPAPAAGSTGGGDG